MNRPESLLLLVPQNQKDFIYLVSRPQYLEEWLYLSSDKSGSVCVKACTMLLLSFKLALGQILRKFVIT